MKALSILLSALVIFISGAQAIPTPQPTSIVGKGKIKQKKSNNQAAFGSINVHRSTRYGVSINWTTASPEIAGFIIERSYDGYFFEEICQMPCEGQSRYRFQDSGVYPGYLYYRVVAVMSDGSEECSATEVVRIVQRK